MTSEKNLHPAYVLKYEKFVRELNAHCQLIEHRKSGARILKIAADDANKTFAVAFTTLSESDAGTPHILEHSVLNGSLNFPVKSPFDQLSKSSLNTFLNAMTADDFTIYPVASMNTKDYFNLMHVYLDAVFNPRIYSDDRIFMQEGWHFELEDDAKPLDYKGVVYNEMKGSYSNPEREMFYWIQKYLFEGTNYKYSAGGRPDSIPTLSREAFLNFHKKNYHPSNGYIFLYGDAPLHEELDFIDTNYLSGYDHAEPSAPMPLVSPFDKIKEHSGYYAVTDTDQTDHQTFLSISWIIGSGTDPVMNMSLNILAEVLVNQESAPIRKALQEANIGKDVYASCHTMRQNMFSIVAVNANAADKESFIRIVFDALRQNISGRINRETLQGTLNRVEFRLREGNDAQKGIHYLMRCMPYWIYANDPFLPLEYESVLTSVKDAIQGNDLEDILQKDLVDNSSALIYVHEPLQGLERKNDEKRQDELKQLKNLMSADEIRQIVTNTQSLIQYQQEEDKPEALATIPFLKIKDIEPAVSWLQAEKTDVANIPHLYYNTFSNNIVYLQIWFNLKVIPEALIPYASLLTNLLGKLNAGPFTYDQLDTQINLNTGGFSTSIQALFPGYNDHEIMPRIRLYLKTTNEKVGRALELAEHVINHSVFDDLTRLEDLLKRHHSQVESQMMQNGYQVASIRLESYHSKRGQLLEKIRGLDYYRFITRLTEEFNVKGAEVAGILKDISRMVFSKNNMTIGITCADSDFRSYSHEFAPFADKMAIRPNAEHTWLLEPQPLNEGFATSSKVQYVLQGFNFMKAGISWNNSWHVLNQILSTDWLQTQVRVIGGAYGGYSNMNRQGSVSFASYRDPNLKQTLEVFKNTAGYLEQFDADQDTMTRYIIGTIANLDYPLTPAEKGDQSFRWYYEKMTEDILQTERDEVLSTTAADIRKAGAMICDIISKQVYCVYGNESVIEKHKDLFGRIVRLNI